MVIFCIFLSASSNFIVAVLGSEIGDDVDVEAFGFEVCVKVGLVVGDTHGMSP